MLARLAREPKFGPALIEMREGGGEGVEERGVVMEMVAGGLKEMTHGWAVDPDESFN